MLNFLFNDTNAKQEALIWNAQSFTYQQLSDLKHSWTKWIKDKGVASGDNVGLFGNYSPNTISLFFALMELNCIVVPLTFAIKPKAKEYQEVAQMERGIFVDDEDHVSFEKFDTVVDNPLLLNIKALGHPGWIFFSSGTTGKSKASLHDVLPLLDPYQKSNRKPKRMIPFLLFDHMGGINTLLSTLADGGCLICLKERTPEKVCQAIEQFHVQVLPTSPTFITMLLMSGVFKKYNLNSLELVTYGTEVMPESTLKAFHGAFPNVKLKQTYGLTEVGVLPTQSKSSESLLIKIGDDGCATRVVNGLLEIKAKTAMMGYLNAPSPFTEDGWLKTEDAVEREGDYYRILGHKTDMINVGGEKVYPAEVEGTLQMMEGVEDVIVTGEPNPITGQIVKASVRLNREEDLMDFRTRMITFCKDKLVAYKIPQKVVLMNRLSHSERYKKIRHQEVENGKQA